MSLQEIFESNKWVKAWLNAPDEEARNTVLKDMGNRQESLGTQLLRSRREHISDEQLRELRDIEVANIILQATNPTSRNTQTKVSFALMGKNPDGGYLMSKQLELHRDKALNPGNNEKPESERFSVSVNFGASPH